MVRRALLRAAVAAAALPRPAATRHVSCDVFSVPLSVEIELGCTLGSSQPCRVNCRAERNYVGTPSEISCPAGSLFLQGHFPDCRECDVATDCSGHAEEVWATAGGVSCACRCTTGYRGDRCNGCAPSYVEYPTCSLDCPVAMDCSGHGVGVPGPAGSCACACTDGYAGAFCGECEAGRGAYPACALRVPTAAPGTPPPTAPGGTAARGGVTAAPGAVAPPPSGDGVELAVVIPAVVGGLCVVGLFAVAVRVVFCGRKTAAAVPAGTVAEAPPPRPPPPAPPEPPPPRRPPSGPPSLPDAVASVTAQPPRAAAKRGTRSTTSSGPARSPRPEAVTPPPAPVGFMTTGFCTAQQDTTPDGAPLRAAGRGGGATRKSHKKSVSSITPPPSPLPHQACDIVSPLPHQARDIASPQPRDITTPPPHHRRSDDRLSAPTPTSTRSRKSRGSRRSTASRSRPSLEEMQVVEADRSAPHQFDAGSPTTAARVNKYLANVGTQLDTAGERTLNPLPPADRAEVMRLAHKM